MNSKHGSGQPVFPDLNLTMASGAIRIAAANRCGREMIRVAVDHAGREVIDFRSRMRDRMEERDGSEKSIVRPTCHGYFSRKLNLGSVDRPLVLNGEPRFIGANQLRSAQRSR